MKDYIVGIDIGSSKVCAAMGKLDKHGQLQIVGVTSAKCFGVKKSTVVDIDAASEAVTKCRQQLETMTDMHIDEAFLSIPGGLCELVDTKGVVAVSSDSREISYKDVERVLKAAKIISVSSDKEIVGVIPEQYAVDGYSNITDPVGMTGIRLEVDAKAVIAQSTVINNLVKVVEAAGLNVMDVIIRPEAHASLILNQEEQNTCTALVDIGADTIDIGIYKGGNICCTSLVPLGGNTLTNDIAKCLKISYSEAESLKSMYGDVKFSNSSSENSITVHSSYDENLKIDRNLLVEIIRARAEEMFTFIKEELQRTQLYDDLSGVLLAGGGLGMFKGTAELGREVLDKPVKVTASQYGGISNPAYTTAVGIVKHVFEKVKIDGPDSGNGNQPLMKSLHSSDNKGSKFITKIKDFIEEFF